jgi:hypothetical protein
MSFRWIDDKCRLWLLLLRKGGYKWKVQMWSMQMTFLKFKKTQNFGTNKGMPKEI